MRAIALRQFGGPEVLAVAEVPDPEPGPEEVLIRVAAAGVNRADLLERQGLYPPPGKLPVHQIPGLEVSGTVEAIGSRVTLFAPDDRVMALLPGGGYAARTAVHERLVMPVPEQLGLVEAAAIPEAFLTAFDALYQQGGAGPGGRVLVHAGASGVGSAAIQLASQNNMLVFATVGSQLKLEACRAFGADRVAIYRHEPFLPAVRAWSGGRGVDVVLDFIGQDYLASNLQALAPDGTLVIIGTLSGASATLDMGLVLGKRLRIQGTALRSRALERKMELVQRFIREAGPLLNAGRVRPVVDRIYPLAEAAEAHRYMATNANIGKILLRMEQDA